MRWENGRQRISHPYVWTYTDAEGYERCYDTRAEAVQRMEADALECAS
jgi:hypothetical protein